MAKNKYFIFSAFLIVFFLMGSGFAHALEVPFKGLADNPTLPQYISFIFSWLIGIAGVLSLISFSIGAISLINPNVEAHANAKDRMKGAVLGLVLTMTSFLIINTINDKLVTLSPLDVPRLRGVFYSNGTDRKPVGMSVADVANRDEALIKGSYDSIIYDCGSGADTSAEPALLIWKYPKANFSGNNGDFGGVTVVRKTCGGSENIKSLGSFRMVWETPGVYFCWGGCGGDNMCSGYMSPSYTNSQDSIDNLLARKIKGVRFVNDSKNKTYYGVIFHKVAGLNNGGICNTPIVSEAIIGRCLPVADSASTVAADIFTVNIDDPASSGNGVNFYSRPFGQDTGSNAGFYEETPDKIELLTMSGIKYKEDLTKDSVMCYDYTNIDAPDTYQFKCSGSKCWNGGGNEDGVDCSYEGACESFQDCPGSIHMKGKYLVALYSKGIGDDAGKMYCETFSSKSFPDGVVPDLKAKPITSPLSPTLDSVYVIPLTK